jgi:hypothetical protein
MNNGKESQNVFSHKRQPYKLAAITLGVFLIGLLALNAVHASFDPPSAPPIGGVPTGIISVSRGGTGLSSPGANNNVLTSNGTSWVSSAPTSQWTTIAGGIYYNSGKVGIGTTAPNNTFQVGNYINFTDPAASDFGTYIGYQAGNVAEGSGNTLIGYWAGLSNAAGVNNTAVGMSALLYNTASNNTALGQNALRSVSGQGSGGSNTATGNAALANNTSGSFNTATGRQSLYYNNTGVNNTANGYYSLLNNNSGSGNIAIGYYSGAYETGSNAFYINNQDRTDTAGDKSKSLMYGTFAVDPLNQKLTINANVGVGTTTPGSKLTVGATNGLAGKLLTVSDRATPATGAGANGILVDINGGGGIYMTGDNGVVQGKYEAFGGALGIGTMSNSPMTFNTNNGERMRILASGNVGIGTTTPGQKLTVAGSVALATTDPSYIYTYNGTQKFLYSASGNHILYSGGVAGGLGINNQADTVRLVTIQDGGNVGIGTASPGAKLEVAGQVKITGGVPGAGKVLTSDASGLASWQASGSSGPCPAPTLRAGYSCDSITVSRTQGSSCMADCVNPKKWSATFSQWSPLFAGSFTVYEPPQATLFASCAPASGGAISRFRFTTGVWIVGEQLQTDCNSNWTNIPTRIDEIWFIY